MLLGEKQHRKYASKDLGPKLSNEKKPGCLGYIGDDELPSYMGIILCHYEIV